MKIAVLSTLLYFSCIFCVRAQPAIEWQKSLGGSGSDWANSIRATFDGGYILAGYANSNNGDVSGHHGDSLNYDYWIVKLDSNRTVQWQKSLGGTADDVARSIVQTADSGYIVAGSSASNDSDVTASKGGNDYWIVKLSGAGTMEWKQSLGGSFDDDASSIQQTNDGGYIVAGSSYSNDSDITGNHGDYDYWIVKLYSNGTIQWQKSLGGSMDDEAYAIQQTADSGYILAGASNSSNGNVSSNNGSYDYWIVKLDASGTLQWQKSFGGSDDDYAYSIQQTADDGYIVAGYSASTDGDITGKKGIEDYWIVKLQPDGTLQWETSLGGSNDDEAYSIQQTTDGGYIVAGNAYSNNGDVTGNHGFSDFWVVKLNSAGIIDWQKSLGGSSSEFAHAVQQTADSGYLVAGWSSSTNNDVTGNHGLQDFWIVKLYPSAVGIEENHSTPAAFDYKVFPNPALSHITLQSSPFTAREEVIISVMNVLGETVLPPAPLQNTSGNITIDVASLPSGIYFIQATGQKVKWIGRFIKE